ncbi:MAG: pyridoxamine 5'-phosphate oxidase [Flavobacteriaceae bacterium]|nr:pyridoxamine 5'-phosphate oxidase [Flavobacteriaceae bacterium]
MLSELRKDYNKGILLEEGMNPDPIKQFSAWFDEALKAGVDEPNAMTLSTVDEEGKPSARIVLLKGVDERGFQFYSNYGSSKANNLVSNPHCSLVFHWQALQRQVRVCGIATKLLRDENEAYFRSRPRQSQLSASISPQSQRVESRDVLERLWLEAQSKYEGQPIPMPNNWGGYNVEVTCIEFWQGRPNRLHDRIEYKFEDGSGEQGAGSWKKERLAP